MSRHENENVENSLHKIKEDKKLETPLDIYVSEFNIYGEKPQGKEIVCAKVSKTSNIGSQPIHYVRCSGSELYNPEKKNDFSYRKRNWKLRQVLKLTFDLYVSFLKTRALTKLHNAERLL